MHEILQIEYFLRMCIIYVSIIISSNKTIQTLMLNYKHEKLKSSRFALNINVTQINWKNVHFKSRECSFDVYTYNNSVLF